ncbi:DNA polymerase III subunit epsilon [Legionella sp. W05-934-2]|jgi:DNA polymerase-3 subunit epsilon|uniref:DNA polymerase III subunit epsilon n=1 Tax=Legionella sp. W05-934-2 TaxID=1198649 RepID=UPI00346383CB
MTRQIVLDTETTGISPEEHRIIEIGCVEVVDRKITGCHYHCYINPERAVEDAAFQVHGISNEFLADKPKFADIVEEFMSFINGCELIIHNAPFDVGFINMELAKVGWKKNLHKYCSIIDTLVLAKKKHPGQRNNLDALCKRYDIDNTNRQLHGALLDAEILASVYLAMTGGQTSLFEQLVTEQPRQSTDGMTDQKTAIVHNGIVIKATDEEQAAHDKFMSSLE